jgi:hypothetical protein
MLADRIYNNSHLALKIHLIGRGGTVRSIVNERVEITKLGLYPTLRKG